jgi:hypothetical protein
MRLSRTIQEAFGGRKTSSEEIGRWKNWRWPCPEHYSDELLGGPCGFLALFSGSSAESVGGKIEEESAFEGKDRILRHP